MKAKFFIFLQYILPQHVFSRWLGRVADSKNRWLKNKLIHLCIRHYNIDLSIVENQNLEDYRSFNEFFIRKLKPSVRPIDADPHSIVSPADGSISEMGLIKEDRIYQAKGFDYTLLQLLAGDAGLAAQFYHGIFATIYLSPRDYHRVHNPLKGKLMRAVYVPGKLFSVNQTTVKHVPGVFARNERLILIFETAVGPMIVILVGAMFVAGIHTVWQGQITPNRLGTLQTWDYSDKNLVFEKGAELGHFQFGSTAIVLFPQHAAEWLPEFHAESSVIMGQALGKIK